MTSQTIDLGHGVTVLIYHKPAGPSSTDAWVLADRSANVTGIALKEWIAERILKQENAKPPTV